VPASSDHPSDEKIRLAEEFIEAGKQMSFPMEPAAGNAPARSPESAIMREEALHEVAVAYAKFFSEEELHGLIAFYRSPLGSRVLEARTALAPRIAKSVRDLYKARFQEWASQILSESDE
jgi:hypothetical protein